MTPANQALAFRIWSYASPKGWDVTIPEIADELGVHNSKVTNILRSKGWLHRVRRVTAIGGDSPYRRTGRAFGVAGFQ